MLLCQPVNGCQDLYHWHRHRHIQSFARLVRRQGAKLNRVRLPPHHDRHHPAGFLVITCPQRPGFRADLGLERTFPPGASEPSDHLFLEITTVSPSRRERRVSELSQLREPKGEGLGCLTREIRRCLLAASTPYHDHWWFSETIR